MMGKKVFTILCLKKFLMRKYTYIDLIRALCVTVSKFFTLFLKQF